MSADAALQRRLDALLGAAEIEEPGPPSAFSPFVGDGVQRAGALATELRRLARDDGLEAAVAAAERAALTEPSGLVRRAVKVFVTHEPLASGRLALPVVETLESRPADGQPSRPPPGGALPPRVPGAPPRGTRPVGSRRKAAPPPTDVPEPSDAQAVPSLTEPPSERALDWYREDPFANDHHAHWHIVYPRDGGGVSFIQPRHGELFFYMHEQMLARYDTERVIAGLERVEPHPPRDGRDRPDYGAAIAEGYGSEGYTLRRAGRSFGELPGAVASIAASHERLEAAIALGRLSVGDASDLGPLTESQLGAAAEVAALGTANGEIDVETVFDTYGNLHGSGHGFVGALGEGVDPRQWGGVMNWTETAICDPFFYRWHKHIDDLNAAFQDASAETNDPATYAPADVAFADGHAIGLCLSRDIPGAQAPGFDFDSFAREQLGMDFEGAAGLLTDQLLTRFVLSRVSTGIPDAGHVSYWTTHLVHEPFTYFVRLENSSAATRAVTVRTFLAHAELVEERRAWIELDKFQATLAPGVNVLARPDARSSVIKRRGVTAPGAEALAADAADQWCDCGWPYSLLLPSGASDAAGTPFRLMVALTDHAQDHEPDHTRTCGSMSYCGAIRNYPDRRRMGYPFDRPFAGQTIAAAIEAAPSMSSVDLTIRCESERPPE